MPSIGREGLYRLISRGSGKSRILPVNAPFNVWPLFPDRPPVQHAAKATEEPSLHIFCDAANGGFRRQFFDCTSPHPFEQVGKWGFGIGDASP